GLSSTTRADVGRMPIWAKIRLYHILAHSSSCILTPFLLLYPHNGKWKGSSLLFSCKEEEVNRQMTLWAKSTNKKASTRSNVCISSYSGASTITFWMGNALYVTYWIGEIFGIAYFPRVFPIFSAYEQTKSIIPTQNSVCSAKLAGKVGLRIPFISGQTTKP